MRFHRRLVLGGGAAAGQPEIFGAIEADAFGAVLTDRVEFRVVLDVGVQVDDVAVGGLGGQVAQPVKLGLDALPDGVSRLICQLAPLP